jgi:hypothetical protein
LPFGRLRGGIPAWACDRQTTTSIAKPSDNDIDREIGEAEKYAQAVNRALALEAVTRWNKLMEHSPARHKPGWSPMVGVAVAARYYFLDVYCPGCRQMKQVDLRKLDRHERTTLHGLIPLLSCQSCQPAAAFCASSASFAASMGERQSAGIHAAKGI